MTVKTKAAVATEALAIFLNNTSVDQILQAIADVRETYSVFDRGNDLEDCAPLILLTGALLQRTTGIFVMTEDTAEKWLRECEELASKGSSGQTLVEYKNGTKKL